MESTYHENYAKQLQKLLNTVVKSQKRYIEASDQIDSSEYKDLFNKYADERNEIISELKQAIQKLGGAVKDTEVPVHHWNSTSTSPDLKKNQSILEKLRSTEQETLNTYDDVLQGSILEEFDLKTLIMSQRLMINEAFTELDRRYFDLFKLSQPY